MNKVGIYFAYWTKDWAADFVYYVDKVAKLGFDVLEVGSAHLLEMTSADRDRLKQAALDQGIELTYGIGFPKDKDMASEDPQVRKTGIEYAKKTLDVIHEMGGKLICGITYSAWPMTLNEGIVDKRPYLERSVGSIRQVGKVAEDLGITYCLEVVNRFEQFLINTALEGVAFVNEVDSPNVKLILDTFHMNIEEDCFAKAIHTAGDKIGHFHIGETNRKTPGTGRMPWDEIMEALRGINYQGRIVMEPFVKMGGEVGRDIKVWRQLIADTAEAALDRDAQAALKFIRGKMRA